MLLCLSSRCGNAWQGWCGGCRVWEVVVDLAGDVALEAADDFAFAESFSGAALDIVAGGLMVSQSDDGDDVEGAVGGTVPAAAEPVSPGGSSAAGGLGCDTAEFGEGRLVADAVCVVPDGDQELAGEFSPDSVELVYAYYLICRSPYDLTCRSAS